jgi:hypothetical protein
MPVLKMDRVLGPFEDSLPGNRLESPFVKVISWIMIGVAGLVGIQGVVWLIYAVSKWSPDGPSQHPRGRILNPFTSLALAVGSFALAGALVWLADRSLRRRDTLHG